MKKRGGEDVNMYNRPPLLEEPFVQTPAGKIILLRDKYTTIQSQKVDVGRIRRTENIKYNIFQWKFRSQTSDSMDRQDSQKKKEDAGA